MLIFLTHGSKYSSPFQEVNTNTVFILFFTFSEMNLRKNHIQDLKVYAIRPFDSAQFKLFFNLIYPL